MQFTSQLQITRYTTVVACRTLQPQTLTTLTAAVPLLLASSSKLQHTSTWIFLTDVENYKTHLNKTEAVRVLLVHAVLLQRFSHDVSSIITNWQQQSFVWNIRVHQVTVYFQCSTWNDHICNWLWCWRQKRYTEMCSRYVIVNPLICTCSTLKMKHSS